MDKFDFNADFNAAFDNKKQTDFENWFCHMAELVWGLDFEKIKAGGIHGDKKSDGRLISQEKVFQCYAPESPKTFAEKAPDKVSDSFPEVVGFWPNLREWVFVHNNDGITGKVSDRLEALRIEYPTIAIKEGSRNYLKSALHDNLSGQQLIDVYPQSPALRYRLVEMEHIRPLLRKILTNAQSEPDPFSLGDIPDEEKLDFNRLSQSAKRDLRAASSQTGIVRRYIKDMNSPSAASQLQAEMKSKYQELKDFGYQPDEILAKLLKWVGDDGTPTVRDASYVILSYYFEACDIYENVPVEAQ